MKLRIAGLVNDSIVDGPGFPTGRVHAGLSFTTVPVVTTRKPTISMAAPTWIPPKSS